MILDAHQHFWHYDAANYPWIDENMAILQEDYLPDDLQAQCSVHDVSGSIAVQAKQTAGETEFLLQLAKENRFIKGVVGWVDLQAPDLSKQLARYAKKTKLKGFRHIVQDEPDPDFLLRPAFQQGLAELEPMGFTYDLLVYPTQLPAAIKTVAAFPKQKFVLDHIAKPYIKRGLTNPWEPQLRELASHPNCYCKVSGLITEADWKNWQYRQFVPYLEVVFDAFGVDRLMFGSDWPVCLLAGSYGNVKSLLETFMSPYSEAEREKVWSRNAKEFYGVK